MNESHRVAWFKPYPFTKGERIHIESGPRRGDWEVVEVTDRKIKLRCPVSKREFDWNCFCYFVERREISEWPQKIDD